MDVDRAGGFRETTEVVVGGGAFGYIPRSASANIE